MRKLIEILEQSPKSLKALQEWLRERITEQFKDETLFDTEIQSAAREHFLERNLQIGPLSDMMEGNSALLFDFFDNHGVFISIDPDKGVNMIVQFRFEILDDKMNKYLEDQFFEENNDELYFKWYNTRLEANLAAIDEAFGILENKLNSN